MDEKLTGHLTMLRAAPCPHAIFGDLGARPEQTLTKRFRTLAKQVHPDRNQTDPLAASEAFALLQQWYERARLQLARGIYGQKTTLRLRSPNADYESFEPPFSADLCDVYSACNGESHVMLKLARLSADADLMQTESSTLRLIDQELCGQPLRAHFPELIESFAIRDTARVTRAVNVLRYETGTVTLADVIAARPQGIDSADMAWMFNRVLVALDITHSLGLVHGAVLPEHMLIRPKDHNGILIDWCYSVSSGTALRAASPGNLAFYPPEVLARRPATPATDIYMAAMCMIKLLGGDIETGTLPDNVPPAIVALLRACTIQSPHRRPNDAWELFEEFNDTLRQFYGPPIFRPFEVTVNS